MFDLVTSSVLIILLLPFVIILIGVYKVSGNWPVLFTQQRIGINGSSFDLLKFRTLINNESLPIEERKFGIGNWLRQSGLDEIPQLINVMKGEMSLVGPRPLPIDYQSLFSKVQSKRFLVKPGITGMVQINGGTQLSWEEKFEYDLQYVRTKSFMGDIVILLKTFKIVFNKKDDGLHEKPFTGS